MKTAFLVIAIAVRLNAQDGLAKQIQTDMALLSTEPALAAWQSSHRADKLQPKPWQKRNGIDFARMDHLCAVSVAAPEPAMVRNALFSTSSASSASLPDKPGSPCSLEGLSWASSAAVSVGDLVNDLAPFLHLEEGHEQAWSGPVNRLAILHREGIIVWIVGNPAEFPGNRLMICALRDLPAPQYLEDGLFPILSNRPIETAASLARRDPELTRAVLSKSGCKEDWTPPNPNPWRLTG